ncbi:MAG: response regulator transcription factor, partial [SAR202 cluster bacterium]|nr:response regulator transcription factor [SAR202 cluster bacterium]
AGASGFLLKNVNRADLLKAIRAVSEGQSLLDPAITRSVIDKFANLLESEQDRALDAISDREREVLSLIAQGMTNRQIAEELVISENTARNHVSRILDKLGLARRSEAAVFAAQHGLAPQNES